MDANVKKRLRLVPGPALLALLAACGGSGSGTAVAPGDSGGQPDRISYTLSAKARPLPKGDASVTAFRQVTLDPPVFSLTFKDGTFSPALTVGDVLVVPPQASVPAGFIGAVTSLADTPAGTQVTAVPRGYEHVFDALTLHASRELAMEETRSPTLAGGLARAAGPAGLPGWPSWPELVTVKLPVHVDWYPFKGEGAPLTSEDQVHVHGTLTGRAGFDVDMKLAWSADIPPVPHGEATLTFKPGLRLDLTAEGASARAFHDEQVLDTIHLPSIPVGPFWFDPCIDLVAILEGGGGAAFKMSFAGDASMAFSAGVSAPVPLPSFHATAPVLSFATPVVQSGASAYLTAKAGPRAKFMLCGVAGPTASALGFAKLATEGVDVQNWALTAGMSFEAGIDVSVFHHSWPVKVVEKTLASGTVPADVVAKARKGDDLTTPRFTPWNAHFAGLLDSFADWDTTTLDPCSDGGYLVSGSRLVGFVKLDKDGHELLRRRYVDRTPDDPEVSPDALLALPLALDSTRGGLVLGGFSSINGNRSYVVGTDRTGRPQWSYRLDAGANLDAGLTRGVAGFAGATILAGSRREPDLSGHERTLLVSLAPDGALNWTRLVGEAGRNVPLADLCAWNGKLAVASALDTGDSSRLTLLDEAGNAVAAREVPGRIGKLAVSGEGDLIIAGTLDSGFNSKPYLMKLKADTLALSWCTATTSPGNAYGLVVTGLAQVAGGNGYLLAGHQWVPNDTGKLWLARTDSQGHFINLHGYGDGQAEGDSAPALCMTGEGGVFLAALSSLGVGGGTGDSLWAMRLPVLDGAYPAIDIGMPATAAESARKPAPSTVAPQVQALDARLVPAVIAARP